jgi:serine/threonine protein kinase
MHENIIKLLELIIERQEVYIIYEYCEGGTLEDKIPISEENLLPVFTQIIAALMEA